jgi:mycothiol synthase
MAADEPLPSPVGPEWVSPVTGAVDAAMRAEGRTMARLLHQMRCDLPLPAATIDATTPIDVRAFRPGDEDGWLSVNNRAFRWHPDQGGWDRDRLADRLAEPWVRLDGFLLHEGAGGIDGFCWTREHPAAGDDPAMGEIFVIAADPSTAGTGLGRSLTVAGLAHLAGRGLRTGMLYVEAINTPALRLYERLGFAVHHSDAAYVR